MMIRLIPVTVCCAVLALANGFTFTIGGAVASQDFRVKGAVFVFRTDGCADPAKSQISATAEGLVKGERKSMVLKLLTSSQPNVYAVYQSWPSDGRWVVNLKGVCGADNAGAVVPIGPKGFIRDLSKFYPRPASEAEIEASLKALPEGGNK